MLQTFRDFVHEVAFYADQYVDASSWLQRQGHAVNKAVLEARHPDDIRRIREMARQEAEIAGELTMDVLAHLVGLQDHTRPIVMEDGVPLVELKVILCRLQAIIFRFADKPVAGVLQALLARIEALSHSKLVTVKAGPRTYCIHVPPEVLSGDRSRFIREEVRALLDAKPGQHLVFAPGTEFGVTFIVHPEYHVN